MLKSLIWSAEPIDLFRHALESRRAQEAAASNSRPDTQRVQAIVSNFIAAAASDGSALWLAREEFRSIDSDPDPCPEVVDVTGRPRCLVFGPHLELEPGTWRATALFELCQDAARRRISVQFGSYPDFSVEEAPLTRAGLHQIELDYTFLPHHFAEVRLVLVRAGFHGNVRFHGAFLRRLQPLDHSQIAAG